MSDYLSAANGTIFYIAGIIITVFVILQALIFFGFAYREGKKCGLTKQQMLKAFRTGAVTSILPSIASVMALIAMIPSLGLPITWIRQSIMGSTVYELTAAGIGAKAMGVSNLGGEAYTGQVFASSIWVMTIGSFWAVIILIFFLKTIKRKFNQVSGSDTQWRNIFINSAFFGVFSIFIADPIVSGGLSLATEISGALFMIIFAFIISKLKVEWLKEFALTFSMIGAMLCAAFFSGFIH